MTETPHAARTFDRVPEIDPKNAAYPMRALLAPVTRTRKIWTAPAFRLDQGAEGACVGNGITNELMNTPVAVSLSTATLPAGVPNTPQEFASWLYHQAQKTDEWPGEAYDGTSVLSGMKQATALGFYTSYHWAYDVEPVIDAIIQKGPVVLGIEWRDGMYDAPEGWLQVTGPVVGGHCILAKGYKPLHVFPDGTIGEAVLLLNSWGRSWGNDGQAWIKKADLADLIENGGEACLPLGRHYLRTPVPSATGLRLSARLRALLGGFGSVAPKG